jgi:hypothetical protein
VGLFLKTTFLLLIVLAGFLLIKTPSFAQVPVQTTTQTQQYLTPNTDANVPNNLHTFSQSLMLEIMSSLACNLSGKDPLSKNGQCLGYDSTTGKIGYVQNNGGALGAMGGMIAMLYTPPLHTSDFIAYMGNNFGLAKPSYAQTTGIGFEGLTPLLNAWVVFRNVVYLLFVFIFIIIGLAIMLRVRIDPRTVMTIQNQIPKIIISLILVTFSFAIAGFLIDLMWVSIYVIINLMAQADPSGINIVGVGAAIYHPAPQFANDVLTNNGPLSALGGIHNIAATGASAIKEVVFGFIDPKHLPTMDSASSGGCSGPFCFDIGSIISTVVLGPVGLAAGALGINPSDIIANMISWGVGILAYLILIIALLWALLRLWFALLKAYISILIDVIFAPFWIISGLIPGTQSAGFSAWIRDMAGNLAAFPAAIMMFLLAKLFVDSFNKAGGVSGNIIGNAFVPPLIDSEGTSYIAGLIAIGVILATPGIVDMTKKAFKAPKLDLGTIGQSIGAASTVPMNVGRRIGAIKAGSEEYRLAGVNIDKATGAQTPTYAPKGIFRSLRDTALKRA